MAGVLEEMDRIRIWQWKHRYDPSDLGTNVYDGGGWHFLMQYGERTIDTSGENAGPKLGHPKATSLDSEWVEQLSYAVLKLTEKSD